MTVAAPPLHRVLSCNAGVFFFGFFFYKRLAEVGARSRWYTKTKCTRCFESGVKVVHNILPKLHNSLLPGLEGPLSYPWSCDSISQCIVLIKSTNKKGTMRVVSQMYHVLLPLWFRRSHTRNLNTQLFIRLWTSVQGVGWELRCYICVAAPLFVQILPVVLGYRTNTTLTRSWEEME